MKKEIKMLATVGILSLSLPACSGDNDDGKPEASTVKKESIVKNEGTTGSLDAGVKSDNTAPKDTTAEKVENKEEKMTLKDAIASLRTSSPFSEHADAFFKSENVLTYGLTYEDDDVENEKPTGFFINVNDASVVDSNGKSDLKAFKKSLKENTLSDLSDKDMEGLFESLINIASESLIMFLAESDASTPSEKVAE